jgi:DNA (cytosine-5)-methyltransferase 1
MRIASFFSGIGGMDLGFEQAGFSTVWANENQASAAQMFSANFPNSFIDTRSLDQIDLTEIPNDVDGFIGGPPCQSWSIAGAHRGDSDPRGAILWTYVGAIEAKKPNFFVLENVPGLTSSLHRRSYRQLLTRLSDAGYSISHGVLNAQNYGAPQARKRLFIVGYRKELSLRFSTPEKGHKVTLRESLRGLDKNGAVPLKSTDRGFKETEPVTAHHYLGQDYFSYIYMSRNRVPKWEDMAFTVQASASHAQIHPSAPPMEKVDKDIYRFAPGYEHLYRRISVRESARIQTFPDDFLIKYESISKGYRMVGNAVPVALAKAVAMRIMSDLGAIEHKSVGHHQEMNLLDFDFPLAI